MCKSTETKCCYTCKTSFPANTEYFMVRSNSPDGLYGSCKKCTRYKKRLIYKKREKGPPKKKGRPVKYPTNNPLATQICTYCHIEKPNTTDYFHFEKRRNRSRNRCISCTKITRKEARKAGRETSYFNDHRKQKGYHKARVQALPDYYCKRLLVWTGGTHRTMFIPPEEVTPEMIEMKRKQLKLSRYVRKKEAVST
jgi:hypothetical protein